MAHTKAGGSTQNGRDSQPKYLGIKLYAGQKALPGSILVRQRGTAINAGINVRRGNDDTLYAIKEGVVRYTLSRRSSFNGKTAKRHIVSVVSSA
ncbi:MAG: 50S ribosomal protein L27 [Parcubacteria group bacterium]|nr:50S ribosomal protein L27 [Parcubacteria group bacterium]